MSSRWRLTVRDDRGRAVITLLDRGNPVGMGTVTVEDYDSLCRAVINGISSISQQEIFKILHDEIWQRAQRAADEDENLAKKRLLELGLSLEVFNGLTNAIVIAIAGKLLNAMPEHVA